MKKSKSVQKFLQILHHLLKNNEIRDTMDLEMEMSWKVEV